MTMLLIMLSTVLSALNNVIIDLRLKQYDPIGLILCLTTGMLPFVLLRVWQVGISNISFPKGNDVLFVLLGSLIYVITDICYFSAYNQGATVATMAVAVPLFPILAITFKALAIGQLPPSNQIISSVLAAIAIRLSIE